MNAIIRRAVLATLLSLLLAKVSVALYGVNQNDVSDAAPARLIVKLNGELSPLPTTASDGTVRFGLEAVDAENSKYAVRKQVLLFSRTPGSQSNEYLRNVYVLTPGAGTDLTRMKQDYEALESVIYAEPDYPVELYVSPNDSLYAHQWALHNTGQGYYHVLRNPGDYNDELVIEYGTPDSDIDFDEVYSDPPDNTSTVVVAIIDTGIDMDHPDLAGRIWVNPGEIPDNGIDDDHNGYIDDVNGWDFAGDDIFEGPDNDPADTYGHGTHCAGIVAAVADNASGVSGISADCKIMPLSFYPWMFTSWAAEAIVYAADNGADVISMSWGLPYVITLWEDALAYAEEKGVILCASAGNDGYENINFPAGFSTCIAVSASDSRDFVTSFSTYGDNIEVCAPGLSILSLRADTTDMYSGHREPDVHIIDTYYYLASGTSMSGPHVAGVASYLRAVSPGITQQKFREILEESSDDLIDPMDSGASLPGWDMYSGFGRVNLNNAITMAPRIRCVLNEPAPHQFVTGLVNVIGTADGDDFVQYVVEIGTGDIPATWEEIYMSTTPVTEGVLAQWDASELSGIYTVKLRVGDCNESRVTVYATNSANVMVSSPGDGETFAGYVDIHGTAICPDFESVVVEYGNGEAPDTWHEVAEHLTPKQDEFLGRWAPGKDVEGPHTLRVSVFSSSGLQASDSVIVIIESVFAEPSGWRVSLGAEPSMIANYGDFDNDGMNEIVFGTSNGLRFFNADGTEKTSGVPVAPNYDFSVPVVVGDLDGDGLDDLVAVSTDPAKLYGFPSSEPAFETDLLEAPDIELYDMLHSEVAYPWLLLKDINDDGMDEIHYRAANEKYGGICVYRSDGTPWPGLSPILGIGASYVVADLDKDSICEIYCAHLGRDGGVLQIDTLGNVADSLLFPEINGGYFVPKSMTATDIDGDHELELIVLGDHASGVPSPSDYYLYALEYGFEIIPGWPHDTDVSGYYKLRPPVFADLNGDGMLEYISSFYDLWHSYVHVWNLDGTPFVGELSYNGLFAVSTGEYSIFMTTIGDVSGDGNPDIVVTQEPSTLSSFESEQMVVGWNSYGEILPGWPLMVDSDVDHYPAGANTPTIGDLDKDGIVDLFMMTYHGDLIFTEFNGVIYRESAFPCPIWHYNRRMNNIRYPFPAGSISCGDVDGNGYADIDDVVYLIAYIFSGGPPPDPYESGDADCSGDVDIDDVVYLIAYIFSGGNPPCDTDGDEVPDC